MAVTDSTSITIVNEWETCHGCNGKGWVDSAHVGACICPVCGGSGQIAKNRVYSPATPYVPYVPWYPTYPYIGDPPFTWQPFATYKSPGYQCERVECAVKQ